LIPQLLVLLTLLASGPIFKVDALLAAPRHAQEVTDYASHFNHGGELIQQMRFHDAVAEFREALRLKPDYLPAHQVLANSRSRCPSTGRLTRIFEYPAICWPDSAPAINMRYLVVVQEEYAGSQESYGGLVEIQAKRNLERYEKLTQSPTTIDGKSALLLSYRGTSPKANNLPIQFLVAIIPSGNGYSRITTWCVEPLFNETQAMFEKIIGSYHSTGTASVAVPPSAPRP
jgi:hypothetical protein